VFLGVEGKMPRVDCLMEMHKREWFCRKEIPRSMEYWEWLKEPHPFPIYMLEKHPDIPASLTYPFREVCDAFLPHLLRGEKPTEYFTSTTCYMIPLAILQGATRLELYGIEAATDTEYAYQRPGLEFWLGIAIGRGLEVSIRPESMVCNAIVYGFAGTPHLISDRLREILAGYESKYFEYSAKAKECTEQFNAGEVTDSQKMLDLRAWTNMNEGAYKVVRFIIENSDYYTSRQNLEKYIAPFQIAKEKWKAGNNQAQAAFQTLYEIKGQDDPEVNKKFELYMQARASMYANTGAVKALQHLMRECDLIPVVHEMVMTIVDVEQ